MPSKSKSSAVDSCELTHTDVDFSVSYAPKGVSSSNDIKPCEGIIGQQRAIDAIRVGLNVQSKGYNIFVTGSTGTGRTSTIRHILEQLNHGDTPELYDVCYVNNFRNEDSPRVLLFIAGEGRRFKKDMGYLITSLQKQVPKIFMSEDYKDRQSRIIREYEGRQKRLINQFEDMLNKSGFVMVQLQAAGSVRNEIQALYENQPTSLERLERLARDGKFSLARLDELRRTWDSLRREFDTVSVESKKLNTKLEDALNRLDLTLIGPQISDKINLLKKRYPYEKVLMYLDEVEEAMVLDVDRFRESQPRRGEEEAPPYRKREPFEEFSVNLILDNSETHEIPIVIERSPSYKNIFGSLERVVDRFGYWRTDFTRIFGGSLLAATGGYFIINAIDLLSEPGMYMYLKRALRNEELEITGYDPFYMMAGSGIKPEPIPLAVKVVVIGEPDMYRLLWQLDPDFRRVFKIKAEFDSVMDCSRSSLRNYFEYIRKTIDEDELQAFDLSGLQAVCEYGMRLAGRRDKLSTRFMAISDIVREAAYCAQQRRAKMVGRGDVYCAIAGRRSRANLVEEKIQELYDTDTIMVSTSGTAVGQINGLSVYNVGDFSFGRPTRLTANVSLGKEGVINIEREADLSGPIHNKGIGVLSGYLRQMFAQDKPLAMAASISFEQSYGGVDGDSASSTEIYAILSAIGGIPIKQSIAVTGSVNQKGLIQPIGGVNEKIEGFYDVCRARRLTGHQGVMIPKQNVPDLLLRPDVRQAIKDGKFHLFAIGTIDEGVEILTGIKAGKRRSDGSFPEGTVFGTVDRKLMAMAHTMTSFGRPENSSKNRKERKS